MIETYSLESSLRLKKTVGNDENVSEVVETEMLITLKDVRRQRRLLRRFYFDIRFVFWSNLLGHFVTCVKSRELRDCPRGQTTIIVNYRALDLDVPSTIVAPTTS